MKHSEKVVLVDDLKKRFVEAKAAYLTQFAGLNVASINELRIKIRSVGGHYQVVKNTLAKLSSEGTSFEPMGKDLKGPIGWAITSGDPVPLAKVLKEFGKENESFSYFHGVMEGQTLDTKGIDQLAELPPKEVLLAQLLGVMQGPARNLACVIQAVPRQLVTVLDAIRKKKEKEETKNG